MIEKTPHERRAAAASVPTLPRVAGLDLTDYRIYATFPEGDGAASAPIPVDLDADVVLIVGTNGSGKSSLVYALDTCLNGETARVRSAGRKTTQVAANPQATRPSLQRGRSADQALIALRVAGTATPVRQVRYTKTRIDDKTLPALALDPETLEQASVFFQDGGGASVAALNRFLLAPSADRERLRTALRSERDRLAFARSRLAAPGSDSDEAIAALRRSAAQALCEAARQLPGAAQGAAPELLRGGELVTSWPAVLTAYVDALAEALDQASGASSGSSAETALAAADSFDAVADAEGEATDAVAGLRRIAEIAPRLTGADVRAQLAALLHSLPAQPLLAVRDGALHPLADSAYAADIAPAPETAAHLPPELLARLSSLLAPAEPGGPDLLAVLAALCARASAWGEAADLIQRHVPRLLPPPLLEALRALCAAAAQSQGVNDSVHGLRSLLALSREAAQLREMRHRDRERHAAIYAEVAALSVGHFSVSSDPAPPQRFAEQLQGAQAGAADRLAIAAREWLAIEHRDAARRVAAAEDPGVQAARSVIDAAIAAATRELDDLGILAAAVRLPTDDLRRLDDPLSRVLSRFHLPQGMLPVRLRDDQGSWSLVTADGQGLPTLSTGQKALLSMGWSVALNLAIRPQIPHRTLVLDDVGAALDAAQLTPLALLLRQLAYTDSDRLRRQIIITVHHEDQASRLIELLHPPPGRDLAVVELRARNVGEPPQPVTLRPRTRPDTAPQTRDALAQSFADVLRQGLS